MSVPVLGNKLISNKSPAPEGALAPAQPAMGGAAAPEAAAAEAKPLVRCRCREYEGVGVGGIGVEGAVAGDKVHD